MDESDRRKISNLEQQILGQKPWQLKGEVGAYSRPLNSLLFEDVKFDKTAKAPEITPQSTQTLEDIIKQRIKNNSFDDPVLKSKPIQSTSSTRHVEISAQKSKVGLAQLYEEELISKTSTTVVEDSVAKEVETKLHALFTKLDALVDR